MKTKKPDQKKMNTLFFFTELYLVVMGIVTLEYGFDKIAIYVLCLAVFTIIIHCVLYRHNYGVIIDKDSISEL